MATIGTFKKNGSNEFSGEIVTLSVQAKGVRIVPDTNRSGDNAPSHRVYVGRAEIGAAWSKTSNEDREYLGLKLDDPSFTAPIYAKAPSEELYATDHRTTADGLARLPGDYGGLPRSVPQLGPPLPGDLGRPMLAAGTPPPMATGAGSSPDPARQHAEQRRQRIAQELDAARTSRLFASEARTAQPGVGPAAPSLGLAGIGTPGGDGAPPSQPSGGDRKLAFLNGAVDRNTVSAERLAAPASPYTLQAGAVIAAAMITGLRSDLPGQIAAHVTENVYDSPTGRTLLIPQGSRLVGQYDAQVSFGQSRALLVWTRLILPSGRSIVLDRQPGADPEG